MEISFLGATRQVTGSMYHVRLDDGFQFLVDCGLDYEKGSDFSKNASFPFDPRAIKAVLLTHAHVDHCGNIPTLFSKGFNGSVFCTEPTMSLSNILLQDSAQLELNKSRRGKRKGRASEKRLYGFKQVMDAVENMITIPFNREFKVNDKFRFEFVPAGHLLGAASIVIKVLENGKEKKILFSGDLGKSKDALLNPPQIVDKLDYMVVEGTYGNREHSERRDANDVLKEHIIETCIDRPGRLIIPAFSVGRTQEILFTLHKMFREGELPPIRIFADSPLGLNSGKIHEKYVDYLNQSAKDFVEDYGNLFAFKSLYLVEDEEDEQLLKDHSSSSILVSSAGMMEGGRIQRHVSANIENQLCRILIAGYCAEGTLGHQLLQGRSSIRVKGKDRFVFAEIRSTDVFSAHPDKLELFDYVNNSIQKGQLQKVFLTHGEEQSLLDFKAALDALKTEVIVPEIGQKVIL